MKSAPPSSKTVPADSAGPGLEQVPPDTGESDRPMEQQPSDRTVATAENRYLTIFEI